MKPFVKNLLALAGFIALLALLQLLPIRDWLSPVWEYLDDSGQWGMLLFVLLSVLLTLLFVPVSVTVFSAGLLFGWVTGFLLASLILLAGATIGFFAGRGLWSYIGHRPLFRQRIFQAIRLAVEEEGCRLIALLRITPFVHFMSGNLFFGSLDLKFSRYLIFSYLGMIPGTLLVVYAGSVANRSLAPGGDPSIWNGMFFGLGLLLFSWVSWRITRNTRWILQSFDEEGMKSTTSAR